MSFLQTHGYMKTHSEDLSWEGRERHKPAHMALASLAAGLLLTFLKINHYGLKLKHL